MSEARWGRRAFLGSLASACAILVAPVALAAPAAPPPKLAILSVKLKPGSDKRFPGETIELTVRIKNTGPVNPKQHVSLSVLVPSTTTSVPQPPARWKTSSLAVPE